MDTLRTTLVLLLTALPLAGAAAAQSSPSPPVDVRIWLDRQEDPVLRRGDRVRVYFRTSEPAWVAIFHVDTNGSVRMVFPHSPVDDHRVAGGKDLRLLFSRSSYWYVDEYEGKGYFFAVASPEPFDFSTVRYLSHERSWDLASVGRTVYEDPYRAMDDYIAALLPDWETLPYGLDFLSYDVGQPHDYPRFLCYDCHGFRSFASWNPYTYACTDFRMVIWDDPYFYPAYRYGPTRVVFASNRGRARFEFRDRAAGEAWSPQRRTRQASPRRRVEYREPSAAEPERPTVVPPRRQAIPRGSGESGSASKGPPVERRAPERRGSGAGQPATPLTRSGESAGAEDPVGGSAREREGSTRSVVPPSSPPPESRPTLQRRPARPTSTNADPGRSSTTEPAGTEGRRPPARVILPGRRPTSGATGAEGGGPPGRGGARVLRPPASRRPTARPPSRPSARPSAGGGAKRPTVRTVPTRRRPRPTPPPRRPPGG